MATIIEGTYEQFNDASFDAVYYMDPVDGRTDTFDIYGMLAGGAIFKVSVPERPARFDQDFPQATKVGMMTIT
jgi:hypothetical protein